MDLSKLVGNTEILYTIPVKTVKPLHPILAEKLQNIRIIKNFIPENWVIKRCNEFLIYLKLYNLSCAVVSISGGVDSSAVFALLKKAQDIASKDPTHPFNPINGGKIITIAQPIHSTPEIQNRAFEVCNSLFPTEAEAEANGISKSKELSYFKCITIDQSNEYDKTIKTIEDQTGPLNGFAKAMHKSYIRTPINYLIASNYHGIVIGTGNLDEDGYLYYYCKFGDGAVDVGLIWDLHKNEVFQVAEYLKIPVSVLIAPPSADLAPGQTDEQEIGATYHMVELNWHYNYRMSEEVKKQFLIDISIDPLARKQFDHESNLLQIIHDRGIHKADLNPKQIGSDWFYSVFKNIVK